MLRNYQTDLTNSIRASFQHGNTAPLAVLPTGGGKTVVFCYIAANAVTKGNRVLILVHRIELLRQTSRALTRFGVDHGIIHSQFTPDLHKPVQVASVGTLVRRLRYVEQWNPAITIIDEAHHANATTWAHIAKHSEGNN